MLRILIIPLALVGMLLGAMVWSGGGVEKRADFAFINRGDIYTLDLNKMSYMQDFRLTYGIREGLYSPDPETMRPTPAGATGHDLSTDKKVWTFHLRTDGRWSNGDLVTARDYVFSWRRMLEEPGEYTYLYDYMRNAKAYTQSYARGEPIDFKTVGMEAVDDRTLRVTLDNPVPYLLELIAFPPFYPRHERSMTKYRVFVDTDVMDTFDRYVQAANAVDATGGPDAAAADFAKRVDGKGGPADPKLVAEWLKVAKNFDPKRAPQGELLDALAVFARFNPLEGVEAPKKSTAAKPDDGAPENVLDELPPSDVLKRMVAGRFVRYTFNKAYTLPPDVVTNGPFDLKKWDFRRRLLLSKSQTYWDRANVKSDNIEMVVSENPQSQLLMYETGQVDWNSDVIGEQAAELKKQGRTDLRSSPAFGTMFLTLMCTPNLPPGGGGGKNPLADPRVRQALAMAIDKRFIVNNITRMDELPARTYLPPDGTLPDFVWKGGPGAGGAPPRAEAYGYKEVQQALRTDDGLTGPGPGLPYDVKRARELLAEAGFPNGQGFPRLPILYGTNSPTRRDICQVLKNQWKQALNIDVQIQGVEGKIFSQRVSAKDYAIATAAWYGDYADASTFTDKYVSTSQQNDSAWVNKAYDDLCDRATREPDEKKRTDMLSTAENMIDTEVPVIPIYHYVNVSLSKDTVHGVQPNPRQITIFKNVWVEKK
jgi:ABC-type oligopeptide transport system substrate-binding subunit